MGALRKDPASVLDNSGAKPPSQPVFATSLWLTIQLRLAGPGVQWQPIPAGLFPAEWGGAPERVGGRP
jgi:hypothetical protein